VAEGDRGDDASQPASLDPAAAAAEYVRLSSEVTAAVTSPWRDLDLPVTQLRALLAVQRRGSLTIGELATALGGGLSAASHLVERMLPTGLVERGTDPGDRRRAVLRLTPRGRARVDRIMAGGEEDIGRLLARMRPEEVAALLVGMRALAAAAQTATERQPSN
jgi:DNA-binding MarR family transcriptional regulator